MKPQLIKTKVKKEFTFYLLLCTFYLGKFVFVSVHLWLIFLLFSSCAIVLAQTKIAVIVPDKTAQSKNFAEKLEDSLAVSNAKILDDDLSAAAFSSQTYENSFNLTVAEAKNIGAAIGCDYFLLVKAENLRRNSLSKGEFYESYAVVFTVSARTGRLVLWKLNSFEAEKPENAKKKLFDSINTLATEISGKLKTVASDEFNEKPAPKLEELPVADSPEAKNFRPPLPYKRFRPEYTALANLYRVEATIDVEIDVDETGKILKIETVRWAGFGLDEAVAENVRRMNWRPASRDGKALPIRVLLRYNFKKVEKEE